MTTSAQRDSMRRTEVDNQANSGTVSRRRGRALALVAAVGCGLILGMVVFFGVGRWLVVEDSLGKARAIAVLSGGMPLRAMEAAKLYREGYAPAIWLTANTAGTTQTATWTCGCSMMSS